MSRWLLCLVAGGLMLPANAAAQMPRLGAPTLPLVEPFPREPEKDTPAPPAPTQPSPTAPTSGDRDLFRSGAVAFQPTFDRLLTPAELGLFVQRSAVVWPAGWPGMWVTPSPYAQRRAGEVRAVEPPERTIKVVVEHRYPPAPAPPATPAPAVVLPAAAPPPPAPKKTLYVIPGCYAGDKRPRRDQLRPGCEAKDLRVISPDL